MRVVIFGATSAIAESVARILSRRGDSLALIGRNATQLNAIAADLALRGAAFAHVEVLDVQQFEQHGVALERCIKALSGLDVALIAHGNLPDQGLCNSSLSALREAMDTNATAAMSLSLLCANYFEQQGHGTIAAISSVAGDRGRASNYAYGAAKAALTTFLSGLRQRLHRKGVHVLTIKPGFVDTPMTAHLEKNLLWSSPSAVAQNIVRGIDAHASVLYTPWFWRPVMWLVRATPEWLFMRL